MGYVIEHNLRFSKNLTISIVYSEKNIQHSNFGVRLFEKHNLDLYSIVLFRFEFRFNMNIDSAIGQLACKTGLNTITNLMRFVHAQIAIDD